MDLSYPTIPTCEFFFITFHYEQMNKYHVEFPHDIMNEFVCYKEDLVTCNVIINSLVP
jgi:hypothetical protein